MRAIPTFPNWPRLLGANMASQYLGISRATFLRGVGKMWPQPIRIGKRTVWDIMVLDRAADALSNNEESDQLMQALEK